MKSYLKRLLIVSAAGVVLAFTAQLVSRNFYIAASVELASETDRASDLSRTIQALSSRIARLESPGRLREIGLLLGLQPLPVENFIMAEVDR